MQLPEVLAAWALAVFSLGIAVHLGISAWTKLRKVEHENRHLHPGRLPAELEARLARIEQIVETTAIEVERVSEAQRYVARQIAEQAPRIPSPRASGKVDTPH